MDPKKFSAVSELTAFERYDYFIRKVCDFEVVWGLYSDGWATGTLGLKTAIPVWPEKEFAARCAEGEWVGYLPREISLSDFLSRWIPRATEDGRQFAVFPTPNDKAIAIENSALAADIRAEASSYE